MKTRRIVFWTKFVPLFSSLLAFCFSVAQAAPAEAVAEVRSPDGHIVVQISVQGKLTYRVTVDGTPIINSSRLGLRFADGMELGRDVSLVKEERSEANETWTNLLGKSRSVLDHHEELSLRLRENGASPVEFGVTFRVFDDGIGFRYNLLNGNNANAFVLNEELTEFTFSTDNVVYAGDHVANPPDAYDSRGGFAGSQEWEYTKQRLSDLPTETVTGLPALTHTSAAWVAVTEADLTDWAGLWLKRAPQVPDTTAVTLLGRLAPRLDGQGAVKGKLPHDSPWRVLMIGRQPGRLVESNLMLNLSAPSQIADPSWIKPGLMAWDHWWSGIGKSDTATEKQFIQFAADMGWPYQLVDGGWYTHGKSNQSDILQHNPNLDLDEVRRFAAEKGVRLWLWLYWSDVDRDDAYIKAFAQYEKWGIAGVKIDFMDRDDQEMVNWYEKIARAGAEHHLMVNFHGAYKPTGMIRTWPNQITREGVMGNEYNKWSTRSTATHRTTLPFTRFLGGPGDYTPGGFVNRQPSQFQTRVTPTQVQGTRASQLALFVTLDSPIMCVSDHPDNLRDQPGIDFLKIVPTVWDETRVLTGAVGEYVVMARRSKADWYLGALTNEVMRVISVKLDFLGEGKWKMRWWRDMKDSSEHADHLETEDREVTSTDTIDLHFAPGGGATAHFVRQP